MASRTTNPRVLRALLAAAVVLVLAHAAGADGFERRFDAAWALVDERYWDLGAMAVDWDEAGARHRPRALAAPDEDAFYAVLEDLYAEIGDDHSVFVPPTRVAEIRATYGDLPCLGVFGAAAPVRPPPGGDVGEPELERLGPVGYALVEDGVGLLRLADLASDGTAEAAREAVRRLERDGARGYVVDLRGNPGGRLITMMQVAGVFTSGFLWRTVTRWSLPIPYPALGRPETDAPVVVLVDGDVHSAAEGLAGALQRSGRARVVGTTTAGNVEAILPFCLRDGSQAWIATGVLAPIGGPTWNDRGVEPDVVAEGAAALPAAIAALGLEAIR